MPDNAFGEQTEQRQLPQSSYSRFGDAVLGRAREVALRATERLRSLIGDQTTSDGCNSQGDQANPLPGM